MLTPLLVLPKVTCLHKGNKMHRPLANGITLFHKDNPLALQVVACIPKEGTMESIPRTACNYCTIHSKMYYLLEMINEPHSGNEVH